MVTAVFAPVAFAGSLADITVSWTRRWIETTVALVVSKLILVLIFVTGYGILVEGVGQSGSGASQKVTQVISGLIVLMLAGFAPWVALKLVHFTGAHAQQLRGLGAVSTAGLVATSRMAHKATPFLTRTATLAASSGGATGAAGATGGRGVSSEGAFGEEATSLEEGADSLPSDTSAGASAGAPSLDAPGRPSAHGNDLAGDPGGEGASAAAPASRPELPDQGSGSSSAAPEDPHEGGDS